MMIKKQKKTRLYHYIVYLVYCTICAIIIIVSRLLQTSEQFYLWCFIFLPFATYMLIDVGDKLFFGGRIKRGIKKLIGSENYDECR